MNPFAELPAWIAVLVALFAAVILIVLNLGWLMAAKSMLDAQRQKNQERRGGTTMPPARDHETPDRSGRTPIV